MSAIDTNLTINGLSSFCKQFFLSDRKNGKTSLCLSHAKLIRLAHGRMNDLGEASRSHLKQCPRCLYLSVHYRAKFAVLNQPSTRLTVLRAECLCEEDGCVQLLAYIGMENQGFVACRGLDEWTRIPLYLRVNLVVDTASDMVALTVLDPPPALTGVRLHTPVGHVSLGLDAYDGVFEKLESASILCGSNEPGGGIFLAWLREGSLSLEFTARKPTAEEVRLSWADALPALLEETKALERDYDCPLPSSYPTDTDANLEKPRASQEAVDVIVDALDIIFRDVPFDAILAHGYVMSAFAKRLALRRRGKDAVHCVVSEECDPLTITLVPGSRILVLTGVSVDCSAHWPGMFIRKEPPPPASSLLPAPGDPPSVHTLNSGSSVRSTWISVRCEENIRDLPVSTND